MKIRHLLAVSALALAAVVIAPATVKADGCVHPHAKPSGEPSGPTCTGYQQWYECPDCGGGYMKDCPGTGHHNFDPSGHCYECGWFSSVEKTDDNYDPSKDPNRKENQNNNHSHYFDTFGVCSCGYYCQELDVRNGWNGHYNPNYYVQTPYVPVSYVPVPVVPVSLISMSSSYGTYPVSAAVSNLRDTANQVALAATLSNLGYKSVVPGGTFNLYAPSGYNATGLPQVITYNSAVSGLKAGDTAFAVYWNGIYHTTQFIPVIVDALGNAAFTVPNMTGTSIVTIVNCK